MRREDGGKGADALVHLELRIANDANMPPAHDSSGDQAGSEA
jgi:hypothetical protein